MDATNHVCLNWIGAECQREFFSSPLNELGQTSLNIVVDFVHAQVDVLELRVLDGDPLLDLLTAAVDAGDLLDIVKLRHGFFGLLL